MAARKAAAKSAGKTSARTAKKSAATTDTARKGAGGFTAEERAAMRERARELKAAAAGEDAEAAVLEKIAAMAPADRALARQVHALVKRAAPTLAPRLWYGMPAYARDGQVVCFFQDAHKFKSRYATLGFSDKATLDEGNMWPSAFAVQSIGPAEEKAIVALLKQAVG